MILEFLGGPWDGEHGKYSEETRTVAVAMPPDVDSKPSRKKRDYSRIGCYRVRADHKFADWIGEQ